MSIAIENAGPLLGSSTGQRQRRLKREAQRSRDKLCVLTSADSRLQFRGTDHAVAALATRLGFEPHDLNVSLISFVGRPITLILAPSRVWHSHLHKRQLIYLKQRAQGDFGRKVIVAPSRQLNKQPRLVNAQLLADAGRTAISATQTMIVEMFVLNAGGASLADCAAILGDHPDPFGAVLAVVHARRLEIALDRAIGPFSMVFSLDHVGQQ